MINFDQAKDQNKTLESEIEVLKASVKSSKVEIVNVEKKIEKANQKKIPWK